MKYNIQNYSFLDPLKWEGFSFKYCSILSAASLCYTLGMVIDVNVLTNWWTIAGVIASFLVAGIALWLGMNSSRQLNKIRRAEKERSGLKEIIDWAIEVIEFTAGHGLGSKEITEVVLSGLPLEIFKKADASARHVKLNKLSSKALYIDSLRARLFPNVTDLHVAIHNVRRRIYEHICYLHLETEGRAKNSEKASQIHLQRLLKDAASLVELTVDTYTKTK